MISPVPIRTRCKAIPGANLAQEMPRGCPAKTEVVMSQICTPDRAADGPVARLNRRRAGGAGPLPSIARLLAIVTGLLWLLQAAAADYSSSPKAVDPFAQNKLLGRGVNVLGYDPIWRSASRGRFQAEHFALIHEAGFNHVRINLHPFRDAPSRQSQEIGDEYFKTLDWAVEQALANKLMPIVNFHEFQEMARDPEGKKERFLAMWKQIAEHFKDAPSDVLFEVLNEPHGELTSELWNQLFHEALKVIRESNPTRTVIVGPVDWNGIAMLPKLELPEADRNLIVTVHYYSPMAFTHQGAPGQIGRTRWACHGKAPRRSERPLPATLPRPRPGPKSHHRPIYLGEFGAYDKAEMSSRCRYVAFVAGGGAVGLELGLLAIRLRFHPLRHPQEAMDRAAPRRVDPAGAVDD